MNNQQYDFSQQDPQQNAQQGYQPNGMRPKAKSIPLCIILSIVTCGIYSLYWLYCMNEDVRLMTGDPSAPSGGMVILLSIITCDIYLLYWMYKQGSNIDMLKTQRGISSSSTGLVYLLLTVFGLGIVSYALMQNEINHLA